MTDFPYSVISFTSILIFALIHLFASKMHFLENTFHRRFLSACSGIAISYVFVDLLPHLCSNDLLVRSKGFFPYIERHVFLLALIGFLLFFTVERASFKHKKAALKLSLASYSLLNFLVGYAVADKDDPDIRPLFLFTIAMGLHYFVVDFSQSKKHGKEYDQTSKWILVGSLFLGWLLGEKVTISETAVALISAFIAGGMMMNVIRHELPKENPNHLGAFILSALLYSGILLFIGTTS